MVSWNILLIDLFLGFAVCFSETQTIRPLCVFVTAAIVKIINFMLDHRASCIIELMQIGSKRSRTLFN